MASTKNKGDIVDNKDIRDNLDADVLNAAKRYVGIVSIWDNPNAGSTGCGRTQQYSTTERAKQYPTNVTGPFVDRGVPEPDDGDTIEATDVSEAIDAINAAVEIIDPYTTTTMNKRTGPSSGDIIKSSYVNDCITTLNQIATALSEYNSWWSGGLCARSCQVSCQTACQTSCQGCNTSQCHNQKCGIH
ncbi:MAG: hypothetical protein ACO239_00495 [Sediminibacterium sp.]